MEVILVSKDGVEFKTDYEFAIKSETIKNLVESVGADEPIPIMEGESKILKLVVDYLETGKFPDVDQTTLFDLILLSNYLDIKSLLDECCEHVAEMIRGKTEEEIKKQFNIE